MGFLFVSFIAGALTVLAPCILPVLPVIIGGSLSTGGNKRRPWVIILSLIFSIVIFTLILKWSTVFIGVPQQVWQIISGVILILFAIVMIFPGIWERIPFVSKMSIGGNKLIGAGYQKKSFWGDVLMGAALGPVFSSCSPTYFVILATILPISFLDGVINLFAYALGLGLVLLLISVLGQKLVSKLGVISDPRGWFKKIIGILFLLVGIFVLTGADKDLQTKLLEKGFYKDLSGIETRLIEKSSSNFEEEGNEGSSNRDANESILDSSTNTSTGTNSNSSAEISNLSSKQQKTLFQKSLEYEKYTEIKNPSGFVNTDGEPVTIAEYIGKKVVLIDFMTYSCINCIRTFPYLNDWYSKYKDDGLVVVGIHTPEFAFEKKIENVEKALADYGIEFPVVLDNDYATWRAWGNRFWPRKYLIDIDGYVVYDHIGEGKYEETEAKIVALLNEREEQIGSGQKVSQKSTDVAPMGNTVQGQSPEVYFGTDRNTEFIEKKLGVCTYSKCEFDYVPEDISLNHFALLGEWGGEGEFVKQESPSGGFGFRFFAGKFYLVASGAGKTISAKVYLDGKVINQLVKGQDVSSDGTVLINESRLYELADFGGAPELHLLELKTDNGKDLELYTLTFGV